jgi:anti-sigma28 factor (negative regulator of flagellin synthesis)
MMQAGSGILVRIHGPELKAAEAISGGVVRLSRVSILRRSIAAGAYRVSSSDVAARLIRVMQERGGEHVQRLQA